jgi:hypothetical protein
MHLCFIRAWQAGLIAFAIVIVQAAAKAVHAEWEPTPLGEPVVRLFTPMTSAA